MIFDRKQNADKYAGIEWLAEALALSERFLNATDVAVTVGSLQKNAFKQYL